jgi:hypothetical protein
MSKGDQLAVLTRLHKTRQFMTLKELRDSGRTTYLLEGRGLVLPHPLTRGLWGITVKGYDFLERIRCTDSLDEVS